MSKQPKQAYGFGLAGPSPELAPAPIIAQRAPTVNDINYEIGRMWIDVPASDVYVITGVAAGAATWAVSSTGTVMLNNLLPDGGTSPVVPSAAHAITLAGGTNITSVGGLNTVTFNLDAAIALATSVTSPLYLFPAATDGEIRATAGQELDITMGDAAGANFIDFRSSTPASVGTINSIGQCVFANFEAGTNLVRINTYTTNLAIIQAFADDDTASGAAVREAIYGNMQVTSGDGNHTPSAVWGSIDVASGSDALQTLGVYGLCTQADGSAITSTAVGCEGELDIDETDAADLPQIYAFGVKGYLQGEDAGGVPATGEFAAVGGILQYNTPFNAYAYGMCASRLGGGAGTAGRAAFGVAQGSQAIADWLYGLDLYNTTPGNAGQAYTTADIRMQNESTIAVDTEGVTFSGDVSARGIYATNSWMVPVTMAPVMATKANTGGVPTGATGDENLMVMQGGEIMEQHINGAGQTIIAPVMDATGLLISLDLTDNEGAEYSWGILGTNRHAYTIGTDEAFFFECKLKLADATGCDPVYIGFRKQEAYQGTFTAYTDYAFIGVEESQNSELITIADELNAGGTTYTNTTDAWTDGQTKTLRVNVSAAGVVTYLIDGAAPTATHALTFDNGDVVMPCIYFLHGAAAPGAIHLIEMSAGYQAWN